MVSDNRWVATTKGIVVFLLTALLYFGTIVIVSWQKAM